MKLLKQTLPSHLTLSLFSNKRPVQYGITRLLQTRFSHICPLKYWRFYFLFALCTSNLKILNATRVSTATRTIFGLHLSAFIPFHDNKATHFRMYPFHQVDRIYGIGKVGGVHWRSWTVDAWKSTEVKNNKSKLIISHSDFMQNLISIKLIHVSVKSIKATETVKSIAAFFNN